jgi:hypothetical protein
MKLIKRLGVALPAAIAAMALLSVSSAAAQGSTVLCKALEETCAAGNKWENVTFELKATNPKITTVSPTLEVKCDKSDVKGTLLTLGTPQKAEITSVTFTNCKINEVSCEVEGIHSGFGDLLRTNVNLGEAILLGTEVFVNCGEGLHCVYKEGVKGHFLGKTATTEAQLTVNVGLSLQSGLFCPVLTIFEATYTVISPQPAYVST